MAKRSGAAARRDLTVLSVAALGVVYGDIGTSPLYTIQTAFGGTDALSVSRLNVLGVLSLIFWALILAISVKYLIFILRADNRGEGGTLSMIALIRPESGSSQGRGVALLVTLAIFGAALIYGDGMITPAISVLSAVEGLNVTVPALHAFVVPITVAVLALLFLFQRRGTGGVGRVFGPIILGWFVVLGVLGARQILLHPGVWQALNPIYGARFFAANGIRGFLALGAVVLAITGGEALYADMGHFGAKPIRLTWFGVVLPALLLNYFGQGAQLLANPSTASNPFYGMVAPGWSADGLLVLSALATVIASQAVISGVFSLTNQAIQLGYAPRLEVLHTSSTQMGQIYLPAINWLTMLATISLVLFFRTSANLAAAYGIAVTLAMSITSVVYYRVAVARWHWNRWLSRALVAGFLVIDLSFFSSNLDKVANGGFVPLAVALVVAFTLSTWKRGHDAFRREEQKASMPVADFMDRIGTWVHVPGTAVFLSRYEQGIPAVLVHNTERNGVLHEKVLIATVLTRPIPFVPDRDRLAIEPLGHGIWKVRVFFGYLQTPDLPKALDLLNEQGMTFDGGGAVYFVGTDKVIPVGWRMKIYNVIARNTLHLQDFLRIPHDKILEVGAVVEI